MPVIMKGLRERLDLYVDDTLDLQCQIQGIPAPTIIWKKDKARLNDSRFVITFYTTGPKNDTSKSRLVLKYINIEDGGLYSCVGINDAGNTSSEIKISVIAG